MRAFIRPAIVAGALFLAGANGSAWAATPAATGLGQTWPNAADVSASPRFHVYVFEKGGLRYVQVNDWIGTVRGAIAVAGNQVTGLPMGVDADHWSAAGDSTTPVSAEQVYRDDTVTVTAAPQPSGAILLMAGPSKCNDPSKCSIRGP